MWDGGRWFWNRQKFQKADRETAPVAFKKVALLGEALLFLSVYYVLALCYWWVWPLFCFCFEVWRTNSRTSNSRSDISDSSWSEAFSSTWSCMWSSLVRILGKFGVILMILFGFDWCFFCRKEKVCGRNFEQKWVFSSSFWFHCVLFVSSVSGTARTKNGSNCDLSRRSRVLLRAISLVAMISLALLQGVSKVRY